MSGFLASLKDDLLDRRLLPFVALVAVALLAAIAYAALGGGSSATPAPSTPVAAATPSAGLSVSETHSTTAAVAETTSGAPIQRRGLAHDPFIPLPGASASKAASGGSAAKGGSGKSSSSTSSSSTGGGSSAGASGGSSPSKGESGAGQTQTSQPAKKPSVSHYAVSVQFGALPPAPAEGAPATPPQLKTYHPLKLNEPLPQKNAQLVYLGVAKSGKDAVFGVSGEAILHGPAKCLPSPTSCQAIELAAGQAETLEALEADGAPVTYELKLLTIEKRSGGASAARAHAASVTARRELARLRHAGVVIVRQASASAPSPAVAVTGGITAEPLALPPRAR